MWIATDILAWLGSEPAAPGEASALPSGATPPLPQEASTLHPFTTTLQTDSATVEVLENEAELALLAQVLAILFLDTVS